MRLFSCQRWIQLFGRRTQAAVGYNLDDINVGWVWVYVYTTEAAQAASKPVAQRHQ